MKHRTLIVLFCFSLFASAASAQDDVMDKIRILEQQIQELKALKQQQAVTEVKREHCMKTVARDKFCSCVSNNLPSEVSFEQYVHTMISSREQLGYAAMTAVQKQTVDTTIGVREKCIEKGFFK